MCRGVVLEGMRRWEEAIADYQAVLAASPNDPSAWNNLVLQLNNLATSFGCIIHCTCRTTAAASAQSR